MKLEYTGEPDLDIPALGITVTNGQVFDADSETGKSLRSRDDFKTATNKSVSLENTTNV